MLSRTCECKLCYVCIVRPISHHPLMGSSAHQTAVSHHTQSVLQPPPHVPPVMTLSTSCPRLDSRFLDSSLDSLQLTQVEIDAIRNLGRPSRGSGASSPSTPTSQLSHPDFVDPRPDIYRFVYDISPGSRSRTSDNASVSVEGGDGRPPPAFQQDSKFDEIVIASMEHPTSRRAEQRHKAQTEESEGISETFLKHTAEQSESESLPTVTESAAACRPETSETVTSQFIPVQSNEMVVSVGDALVTVPQSSELVAPEDRSEMQQLPMTTATDTSSAVPNKLRETASSRIHKGSCCIFILEYLNLSCILFLI